MAFLNNYIVHFGSREGTNELIRESCMFFEKDCNFDSNADLFQLQNSVVDLKTNKIRYGRPSDMWCILICMGALASP